MKKILLIIVLAIIFLFGCTRSQPLDKENAIKLMKEQGCWWDPSEEGVYVTFQEPDWVMGIDRCGGTCRVNSITQKFEKSGSSMCLGAIVE